MLLKERSKIIEGRKEGRKGRRKGGRKAIPQVFWSCDGTCAEGHP
jgi:hypothetical protein